MSRNLHRARFAFVGVCLMLTAAPAAGQEDAQSATLRVRLPAAARLVIDGKETKQTGEARRFYSPPLEAGKSYHYTLEWTYEKDGKRLKGKKVVHVHAGDNKSVDLRNEDVKEESKPPVRKDGEPDKKKDETKQPVRKPDVDFFRTPPEAVDKMLELAAVKKDDVVYDPGCGDGGIVVAAAKKYGCKAVGIDINPQRVKEAKAKANGVEDLVTIKEDDLFKVDLAPASVVTLYLLPDLNVKLLPQLEKLKKGARIVSYEFAIKGVTPKQMVSVETQDGRKHKIYLWETPLKKE